MQLITVITAKSFFLSNDPNYTTKNIAITRHYCLFPVPGKKRKTKVGVKKKLKIKNTYIHKSKIYAQIVKWFLLSYEQ